MNLINALNTGVLGIQRGLAQAQRSAATIASADSMTSDQASNLAEPLINLMIARHQVEASVKVVETIDETLGTLIDELA